MSSAELSRAKTRYAGMRDAAYLAAAKTLVPVIGVDFRVSGWTRRAYEAYVDQWTNVARPKSGDWDWPEIFRVHRDPDRLDLVIWSPNDRLSGLSLGTLSNSALNLRFLEGDPRSDCPLKGKRILIVLECAANYAQARGRSELRVQPLNEDLETLYRDGYGFTIETQKGVGHYYKKVV